MTDEKLKWNRPNFPNAEWDQTPRFTIPDDQWVSINGGPPIKFDKLKVLKMDEKGALYMDDVNKGLVGNFKNIRDRAAETAKAVDDAFREGTSQVIAPAADKTRQAIKTGARKLYEAVKEKISSSWEPAKPEESESDAVDV